MTLHCTLVGGPGSGLDGRQLELSIDAPEGATGAGICEQLTHVFGTGTVTVDGDDLRSMRLGSPPLVSGAVLVDGGSGPVRRKQRRRPPADPAVPLVLAVHSGAAAGTIVPLRRGTYTIGRSDATLVIADAELSRQHARVVVTDTHILIEDLDSANGTYVDGERIRNTTISTGSAIRCGNSTMSLLFAEVPEKEIRDAGTSVQEPITVQGRPDAGSRTAMVVTACLPLAIGVGLAVFTGMWIFLAFSAASALALLIPLLTGRRQRREIAAAVRNAADQDRRRRQASAPSLALLVLAAGDRHGGATSASDDGGIWLRLGQAEQRANVTVTPAADEVNIPLLGAAPVVTDLSKPLTVIQGSPPLLAGLIRALVMQLAGYPRCRRSRIVIHGQTDNLPLTARYLPQVVLTASADDCRRELQRGFTAGYRQGYLLVVAAHADPGTTALLTGHAVDGGWHVVEFRPAESEAQDTAVNLFEHAASVRDADGGLAFIPDLATEEVFSGFCRLAANVLPLPESADHSVPEFCVLGEALPLTAAHTAARWEASGRSDRLDAPLGLSAAGIQTFDLQADGPHLLVAGTTGSGKSELLRSLTLSLALSHPPDRVNFLFVDFKGGSGLAPLTELVHCVGLLTDLNSYEIDRTLASLRAEIRIREEALASAHVPDLVAYRKTAAARELALPHLVIMIDEFRMLVDDAPEALRELMRIASIGRSLGIHLVMATQRPQGALTADIRANVTSSIALRVQSDMESVDIIGSKAAAGIRLDAPGRAYLARGTEPVQEFQAATTCLAQPQTSADETISVRLAADYLRISAPVGNSLEGQTPAQAAAPLISLIRELWAARQGAMPRVPVAPPLPQDMMEPCGVDAAPVAASPDQQDWSITLGLMDVPSAQRVQPLMWEPGRGSHLAFIGAPISGAADGLELAVRRLLGHRYLAHCYILDGTGTFHRAESHPKVGALTGLQELRRAVRVLERLAHELNTRLSLPVQSHIPLVVVISGWGSWVSAFRSGPLAWAEDLVHDLVRDGAQAGITVVLSGDRELVTSRFFAALPNRLYFPAGSTEESRVAWPRMPATAPVKSRAVAFGPLTAGEAAVCQLYSAAPHAPWPSSPAGSSPALTAEPGPFQVQPLPPRITAAEVHALPASTAGSPAHASGARQVSPADVLIGVGGDELSPTSFRIPVGGVVAVLGTPGSGKTNTLRVLQALNPLRRWVNPDADSDGGGQWKQALEMVRSGRLPQDAVVLADDADLLSSAALHDLAELQAMGQPLVLTANYSPALLQRVPLIMACRAGGTGLLLCPRSTSDGDVLGVRFEVETAPPPGRAVLISGGRSSPLQVALADPGP